MGGQRLMGTSGGALILEAKDPKCQDQGSEAWSDDHRDQEQGKHPWGPKTWQWEDKQAEPQANPLPSIQF